MAARLNGWQRLWVVLTVAWTLLIASAIIASQSDPLRYFNIFLLWLLPIPGSYALGWAIGWVARGFKMN